MLISGARGLPIAGDRISIAFGPSRSFVGGCVLISGSGRRHSARECVSFEFGNPIASIGNVLI